MKQEITLQQMLPLLEAASSLYRKAATFELETELGENKKIKIRLSKFEVNPDGIQSSSLIYASSFDDITPVCENAKLLISVLGADQFRTTISSLLSYDDIKNIATDSLDLDLQIYLDAFYDGIPDLDRDQEETCKLMAHEIFDYVTVLEDEGESWHEQAQHITDRFNASFYEGGDFSRKPIYTSAGIIYLEELKTLCRQNLSNS